MQRMNKYWSKHEETTAKRESRVAKEQGGRRVPGSGNTPWAKEDISTENYLIQHKHTDGKSISVTYKALEDLRCNAIDTEKEPLMILEYDRTNFYILNEVQFREYQSNRS